MPYVSIHIKTTSSGLIKNPCILVSYHKTENSGLLHRMLNHRQVELQFLLKRFCSEDEYKSEADKYRVGFFKYSRWKLLIEDEMKFTTDENYLSSLEQLRKKYKQFEIAQGEIFN